MIDALVAFLSTPQLFGWLLVAVPIGLVFGIIPGFGGKFAIIAVIPFLFGFDPAAGAVFLISLHAVVHTGGALPSILFGIPGTGPSTAIVADGHAMALRGEAVRALTAAIVASVVGGIVGAVLLALVIPISLTLLKLLSYPEMFLLSLFGIIFCAVLSEGALVKGLITGCLGLLLATVGTEIIFGVRRFTLGQPFLWDGIDIITAILALYAIPEMISLSLKDRRSARAATIAETGVLQQQRQGFLDVVRFRWLALRTSVLGALIGVIPGLGGDVAAWFCYGHAAQSSDRPDRFGKGAVEGIIGPEAANNSKEGGALVPTLFLGIPGSSGMALLLVALVPLGLNPGPNLVEQQPQLLWLMVWALVASNIVAAILLYFLTFRLSFISQINSAILVPYVYLFAMISVYLSAGEWRFLIVMGCLAGLGYAFKAQNWPRAPFVVGFILGPTSEAALVKAWGIWGAAFMLRPGAIILTVLLTLALVQVSRRVIRSAGSVQESRSGAS